MARAIGDADTVLVLDNCEHLLSTVDPLVEELLGRCPNLRLVATSREGLAVCGELLYTVGPLVTSGRISLFEQRIAGLVADGDVGTDVIAEICERLDRLPLGIELAAGRARHMRLGEVLERLTDRFDLLRDDTRVSRPHQRDLQAVADWSYDLLDQPERIVFERLSVFSAGATLAGARAVCSDDDGDRRSGGVAPGPPHRQVPGPQRPLRLRDPLPHAPDPGRLRLEPSHRTQR